MARTLSVGVYCIEEEQEEEGSLVPSMRETGPECSEMYLVC